MFVLNNIHPDSTLVSTLIILLLHVVHIYAIYSVMLVYDVWRGSQIMGQKSHYNLMMMNDDIKQHMIHHLLYRYDVY